MLSQYNERDSDQIDFKHFKRRASFESKALTSASSGEEPSFEAF